MKREKDLRSEAAMKEVIKMWPSKEVISVTCLKHTPVISFWHKNDVIAEIDLRALIKRRAPLTGARKALDKIVRGTRKGK